MARDGRYPGKEPRLPPTRSCAMSDLSALPTWTKEGTIHVVVETPRGARAKVKLEPDLGVMMLTKPLMLGLAFPYDFGFIPSTHAEDGDPLDALVIHDAATWPGLVIRCRASGVVKVAQREQGKRGKVRNDRIIAVPEDDPRGDAISDARKLSKATREQLEKFFVASVALKGKELTFLGWGGPDEAARLIRKSEQAFREQKSA
jgi:inorganic pyrophosphatase